VNDHDRRISRLGRVERVLELLVDNAHERGHRQGQRDARPAAPQAPRFGGYYLIEAGKGVLSSLGLFETAEQAEESGKLVAKWITDEHFTMSISAP
jgi:hypothetical protein